MIFSAGSASYGNHTAAAAADVVCGPVWSAKMVTPQPHSARTTPQVRPETPAPIMAARFCTPSVLHHENSRAFELALAQSRQRFVRLFQRECFRFGFYGHAGGDFEKFFAIAAGEIRD